MRRLLLLMLTVPLVVWSARFPHYASRERQSLSGTWSFAWLGDKVDVSSIDPSKVACPEVAAVPGVYDTSLARYGRRGTALYRRRVTTGEGRYRLTFEGLGLYAKVWLDGAILGEIKIPWSTVSFDFDARAGEHDLAVLVDNRYSEKTAPLFKRDYDFYPYGGIYRDITLTTLPRRRVERILAQTLQTSPAKVRITVFTEGARNGEKVALHFNRDLATSRDLSLVSNRATGEFLLDGALPWTPDRPELQLVTADYAGDRVTERFGVRTIATRGRTLLLNGEPLKLYGVNRHEAHPQFGPVQNLHLMLEDIRLVRELGGNFIRTVHYQHDPAFYELCDETGMLLWVESLGWGLGGYGQPNNRTLLDNLPLLEQETLALARIAANHPSIILAGFLNECASDNKANLPVYQSLAAILRTNAPNALVSYASNRIRHDVCMSVCDVVSVNYYPGWIWPESHGNPEDGIAPFIRTVAEWACDPKNADVCNKPLITSETGCCGVYGVRDPAAAQWSEEYQSRYLSESIRASMGTGRFAGVCIWQMFDTRSYVNMGNVRGKFRGFNNAGLLDEYRRPKEAFRTVRRLFRELRNLEESKQ